mgnify:CR=1 FL=1
MKRIVLLSYRNPPDTKLIGLLCGVFPECRIECLHLHDGTGPDGREGGFHGQGEPDEH